MLVRRSFNWGSVETSATSGYNWSGTDAWIAAATAKGIKIMAVASQAPAWATNGRGAGNKYPEGHQSDFYDFCAAAAARYPQVAYWEIMNEPDLNSWTSAQVAEILIGAANAVVGARPAAKCIGICTAGSFARLSTFVTPILNAIRGVSSIYGVSFHDYTRPYAPELVPSGRGGPLITQMNNSIAMMDTAGFTGKLFITEFGCPTTYSGTRLDGYVSEADAARWIVRQSIIHGSYSRMERSVQFQLFGSSTAIEEGGMGLIRGANDRGGPGETSAGPAGSKKPGYFSYQNMMDILDENTTSITAQSTGPLYKYRYDKVGGVFGYIVWTTTGTQSAALTGLTDTVTVTQNNGTSATQSTTSGNITITATVDPQYIETIAIPVQPVSWWESKYSLAGDLTFYTNYMDNADSGEYYTLGLGIDGNRAMYDATGKTVYLDRALLYTERMITDAAISSSFSGSSWKDSYYGWIAKTLNNIGDEVPLHEFYCWRYVALLIESMQGLTGSYGSRRDAILAFTEQNIWRKWWARGANGNIYRNVIHISCHAAIVAAVLKQYSTDSTIRSQAATVQANIDNAGISAYSGGNIRSQLVAHPNDSSAYYWTMYWNQLSQSEPYGSDVAHGSGAVPYMIYAKDHAYGTWSTTDMNKLIKLFGIVWPDSDLTKHCKWLIGPSNTDTDSGNYSDGFIKLGRYSRALQKKLESYTVSPGSQTYGNLALNAKILLS